MYDFSPLVQLGIAAGKYISVKTAAGVPIGMVRDAATGQFAAHAIGITGLNPLTAVPHMLMGAGQLYQGQKALQGIKALSASVATLQATTAVIGVGTVAVGALAAVNLWQTLKLRKDVRLMRVEIQDGFIDLKQLLTDQGTELIEHIRQVSEDVEFQAHRTILARAYGLFEKAMNRLQSAATMRELGLRSAEITAARNMMFQALADYDNDQLMSGVGAVAYLRRRECVWVIEQAIAMTYQMQGEWQAVGDRLGNLSDTIYRDARYTLDKSEQQCELDFLFPELSRIRDHDLVALEAWRNHINWYQELSGEELKQLNAVIESEEEGIGDSIFTDEGIDEKPAEYVFYEDAKSKFIPEALHESLVYSFDAEARQAGEAYIAERAELEALRAFSAQNLYQASPLTVANLELYFALRDESLVEDEKVEATVAAVA